MKALHSLRVVHLSKKAVKEILALVGSRREIDPGFVEMLKGFEEVRAVYGDRYELVVFDNLPALFKIEGRDLYMPTLYAINVLYNTKRVLVVPSVVVDEGAVAPLKRGADVMIPGIRRVLKGFGKGDIVAVMEPGERYFIVVGIALVDSSAVVPGAKGKGIENVSHVDDDIWAASLQISRAMAR